MQPKSSFDSANKYCITFLLAKTINENKSIAARGKQCNPNFYRAFNTEKIPVFKLNREFQVVNKWLQVCIFCKK